MSSHSTELGATERLAVSPKTAGFMIEKGLTQIYALIGSGELESYKDGVSRRITMRSIRAYMERRLQASEPPISDRHPSRRRQAEAKARGAGIGDPGVSDEVQGGDPAPVLISERRRSAKPPPARQGRAGRSSADRPAAEAAST